jgi:hypothetical protein
LSPVCVISRRSSEDFGRLAVKLRVMPHKPTELSSIPRFNLNPTPPNKASEPTSTSVTARAVECFPELKHWSENWSEARAAPAVAVAHL